MGAAEIFVSGDKSEMFSTEREPPSLSNKNDPQKEKQGSPKEDKRPSTWIKRPPQIEFVFPGGGRA